MTSAGAPDADALVARMKAARGYLYPEVELAVRMDPAFMEAYDALVDRIFLYSPEHAEAATLPAKYRELVVTALLAERGRLDHVVVHARRAMRMGATGRELLETFEAALAPAGLPAFLTGLEALQQVLSEADGDDPAAPGDG